MGFSFHTARTLRFCILLTWALAAAALGLKINNGKFNWSLVDSELYDFRPIDPQIDVADNGNLIKGGRYASN